MNLVSDRPNDSSSSQRASRVARGLLIAAVIAGGLAVACGGGGSGSGGVAGLVAALEVGLDMECNCLQLTAAECSSQKAPVRTCVEDAAEEAGAVPSCAEAAVRNYTSCLQRQGQCTSDGLVNAECDTAFVTARSNCALDPSVIACFGGEAPANVPPGDDPPGDDLPGDDPPGDDPPPPGLPGCTDTCFWADDDECDDGRPGAFTSACDPGTDCADCGPL
jgi:hypothetical protein